MGLTVDILIVVIFGGIVAWSAYKGAVKTLLGLASLFLAVFCAVKLAGVLAPVLYDKCFSEPIIRAIEANLPSQSAAASTAQQAQAAIEALPELVRRFAGAMGIDVNEISAQIGSYQYSGTQVAENIAGSVIAPLVTAVCKVVVFIVAFLLLLVVLRILIHVVDHVFDLPVLGTLNRVFGGLLGVIKGLLAVVVLCAVASLCVDMFCEADAAVAVAVKGSQIVTFVNGHNPLLRGMF